MELQALSLRKPSSHLPAPFVKSIVSIVIVANHKLDVMISIHLELAIFVNALRNALRLYQNEAKFRTIGVIFRGVGYNTTVAGYHHCGRAWNRCMKPKFLIVSTAL